MTVAALLECNAFFWVSLQSQSFLAQVRHNLMAAYAITLSYQILFLSGD